MPSKTQKLMLHKVFFSLDTSKVMEMNISKLLEHVDALTQRIEDEHKARKVSGCPLKPSTFVKNLVDAHKLDPADGSFKFYIEVNKALFAQDNALLDALFVGPIGDWSEIHKSRCFDCLGKVFSFEPVKSDLIEFLKEKNIEVEIFEQQIQVARKKYKKLSEEKKVNVVEQMSVDEQQVDVQPNIEPIAPVQKSCDELEVLRAQVVALKEELQQERNKKVRLEIALQSERDKCDFILKAFERVTAK